jgi:hypothetical protein
VAQSGVRVEGLNTLVRTLKRAQLDVTELTEANAAAGRTVAAAAELRVPKRTGKLAGSIRAVKQVRRARVQAGRASVPYAGPIHWGWATRGISPQPFISVAARATEPEWAAGYRKEVERVLAKVRGL